ncbi:uncharacterized protein LOC124887205 [Capsicum annuum]|uniref:uncharacterized protein LOC124887205 n=1 Tax=Capsicum annuum TaxID=4072 RepID=UPI001FB1621B|nr:uncharacterized protein LOC124887205 [Capsicum annuum]
MKLVFLLHQVDIAEPSKDGNKVEQLLSLRHPKSGTATCYLCVDGSLQELHWFKRSYGSLCEGELPTAYLSMLLGARYKSKQVWQEIEERFGKKLATLETQYLSQGGRAILINSGLGSLLTYLMPFCRMPVSFFCTVCTLATPVDPVFVLLPIFEEARMKKQDDPGKFRQVDEIIYVVGYPGYQHLSSVAENCMQVVCDVKGNPIKKTLLTLDKNYAARDKKEILSDAVSIIGEYLKEEPWLKLLCRKLCIDLQDET